ncbi:MAG: hypothetical protein ACSLFE_07125 [Gemmatimonadaceae bacterium]
MHPRQLTAALLSIAALGGCASAPPVVETGTASTGDRAAALGAAATTIRYSGTLQPTQQRTGMAAPTAQNKAYGSVFLAQIGPSRMRVRMNVSTPIQSSRMLQWAIHTGRCGSGTLPIVGVERFPVLEVGTSGRADLDAEMPLTMPETGTFHVNVFLGGQNLNNVLTCANLRREGGR